MIHGLYLHCVPTIHRQTIFHHRKHDPIRPFLPPTPFPLAPTLLLSMYMSFCLFVFPVYPSVASRCIFHI